MMDLMTGLMMPATTVGTQSSNTARALPKKTSKSTKTMARTLSFSPCPRKSGRGTAGSLNARNPKRRNVSRGKDHPQTVEILASIGPRQRMLMHRILALQPLQITSNGRILTTQMLSKVSLTTTMMKRFHSPNCVFLAFQRLGKTALESNRSRSRWPLGPHSLLFTAVLASTS